MKRFPHAHVMATQTVLTPGQVSPVPAIVYDATGQPRPPLPCFVVQEVTYEDYAAQIIEDGGHLNGWTAVDLRAEGYRFYEVLFD